MGARHGRFQIVNSSLPLPDEVDGAIWKNVEEVRTAIIGHDLKGVQDIMDPLSTYDKMAILILGVLVVEAIQHQSLDCLRYFLELHKNHEKVFKISAEFHQSDGFVDKVRSGKNAYHLIAAMENIQTTYEASSLLAEYSWLVKSILDKEDDNGITPLFAALQRKNTVAAQLLVRSGACFHNNCKGLSPLIYSMNESYLDILEEMMNKVSKDDEAKSQLFEDGNLFGAGHTIFYAASFTNDDIFCLFLRQLSTDKLKSYLEKEIDHDESQIFLENICKRGMTSAMTMFMNENKKWAVGLEKHRSEESHNIKALLTRTPEEDLAIQRETPLMWAVKANKTEMIDLILSSKEGMETVDFQDSNGRNVFHYAAEANPAILKHIQELLQDKYVEMYNKKDNRGCIPLHRALVAETPKNAILLLDEKMDMTSIESIFNCEFCMKNCKTKVVQSIFDFFENCKNDAFRSYKNGRWRTHKTKLTPVHAAAQAGRVDILEILLSNYSPMKVRSAHCDWTPIHFAVSGRSLSTVKFFILNPKSKDMINWRSDDNKTAAVLAAENGSPEILQFLLMNGANVLGKYHEENLLDAVTRLPYVHNREVTAYEIIIFCDKNGGFGLLEKLMKDSVYGAEGVMSKLVEQIPNIALEILKRCSESLNSVVSNFTHSYHLFPIQNQGGRGGCKPLTAIDSMVKYKRHDCLSHPIVMKFLEEKWNKSTAKKWYLFNFTLYVAFLVSITTYIGIQERGSEKLASTWEIILSVVCFLLTTFNIIKEIIELRFTWKEYLFELNNYMEWMIYFAAMIYIIPPNKEKTDSQIQAGAFSVLLAWINFIWFLKWQSNFGIYIIMAKKVFISLIKVLPMVVLFIFAFAMAFFVLMSKDEGYETLLGAILTTSVMMVGEIDYRGVFLEKNTGANTVAARFILFAFLLIITIVIMNLLVGLAVGDTDDIMRRSKAEKRIYKASLIVAMQQSFSAMPWVAISEVADPLMVNVMEQQEKQSLFSKILGNVYSDNQIDEECEKKVAVRRLEKREETTHSGAESSNSDMYLLLESVESTMASRLDRMEALVQSLLTKNTNTAPGCQ